MPNISILPVPQETCVPCLLTVMLELIWDRPTVNVFGYEIYRDHELLTFTNGTSFLDNTIAAGAKHHYDIVAVDANGQILGFDGIAVGGHE